MEHTIILVKLSTSALLCCSSRRGKSPINWGAFRNIGRPRRAWYRLLLTEEKKGHAIIQKTWLLSLKSFSFHTWSYFSKKNDGYSKKRQSGYLFRTLKKVNDLSKTDLKIFWWLLSGFLKIDSKHFPRFTELSGLFLAWTFFFPILDWQKWLVSKRWKQQSFFLLTWCPSKLISKKKAETIKFLLLKSLFKAPFPQGEIE